MLTYIRRAWGNTGSPIAAVEVRETRQGTVHTGVWTEEELTKLLQAAGRGRGGQTDGTKNEELRMKDEL